MGKRVEKIAKVTKQQIEKAKQMDLLTYLQSYEPDELVKAGLHDYRTKTHSSLVVSDNGLWYWHSMKMGGKTALKYLCNVYGMEFTDAVVLLCENESKHPLSFQRVKTPVAEEAKILLVPPADQCDDTAMRYLLNREIEPAVLDFCKAQKILYQSSTHGYANCAFVCKDENGMVRSVMLRGCKGSYRGNAYGSNKKYGFCILAENPAADIVEVYEAPIDALSGASLRLQQQGDNWKKLHYLAMGGFDLSAIELFLHTHPQVKKVAFCLDNDAPGRVRSAEFILALKSKGYIVQDRPPRFGKDFNDTLRHVCYERKQIIKER